MFDESQFNIVLPRGSAEISFDMVELVISYSPK